MKKTFGSSANVNVQEDRAGLEGSGADHGGSHPGGSYHASAPCWLECRARSLMSEHWICMVLGLCAGLQNFLCLHFLSPYDPLMGFSPVLCSLDHSCMPSPADLMTLTILLCAPGILSTLDHKGQHHPSGPRLSPELSPSRSPSILELSLGLCISPSFPGTSSHSFCLASTSTSGQLL